MPEAERLAAFAAAEQEHIANPTDNSAIRLAMLSLGIMQPNPDYESVLALLTFAEGSTDDEGNRAFAGFFRPVVRTLANLTADLAEESSERRVLEMQLEALKELEEQLSTGTGER